MPLLSKGFPDRIPSHVNSPPAGIHNLLFLRSSADRIARMQRTVKVVGLVLMFVLLPVGAISQSSRSSSSAHIPEDSGSEFQMARLIYRTSGCAGSHGICQPWWAIDYPYAEEHFLAAMKRLTKIAAAEDSWHLEITDDRIFQHPFLFMQQPAQGGWDPTEVEAQRMREYLARGGFLLVDDFHGEREWDYFAYQMGRVLPDREIVEIPNNDPIIHVFYDLTDRKQLPGDRHLRGVMLGEPHWRGIYDDHHRLMVAMNFNMDMGDSWEHADRPDYPAAMTVQGYQLGINYVLYSMTH